MNRHRKFLVESRDFWQESANYDKKQILASFAIASTGIAYIGVGIGTIINGNLASGVVEVGVGSAIAIPYFKMSLSGIKDYAESTAITAVRQNELDKHKVTEE